MNWWTSEIFQCSSSIRRCAKAKDLGLDWSICCANVNFSLLIQFLSQRWTRTRSLERHRTPFNRTMFMCRKIIDFTIFNRLKKEKCSLTLFTYLFIVCFLSINTDARVSHQTVKLWDIECYWFEIFDWDKLHNALEEIILHIYSSFI